MAIQTSNQQFPVAAQSTTQLQQWNLTPAVLSADYYQGGVYPPDINVSVVFKDIISTAQANPYTDFTYHSYLTFNQGQPEFVTMAGALVTGISSYVAYINGLSGNIVFTFQNLSVLAPAVYYGTAFFEIWGKNSMGINMLIERKNLPVKVRVFGAAIPVVSVNELNFAWTLGGTLPVIGSQFTIDAPSWSIRTPQGFYFLEASGTTLLQPTAWGGAFMTGEGAKVLQLVMMPAAEPAEVLQNPLTLLMEINGGAQNVPIHITFLQQSGLFIEKERLEFLAYKSIEEAAPQTVNVYNAAAYTITCPPWMTVSPAGGAGTTVFTFTPLSANNMEQGIYTGVATIKLAAGGAALGEIDLRYEVIGAVISPYEQEGIAFTLDRVFLRFLNTSPEAYFNVALHARIFDFYGQTYRDETLNFKVPMFQGRQELNIGQTLHRLMARIPDLQHYNTFAYNPAVINLTITEYAGGITTVYDFGPFNFVAGLSPALSHGSGFLDINPGARRVTPNSWQVVNMLVSAGTLIKLYKNGVELSSDMSFNTIYTRTLDFSALGALKGDVFELRLERPELHSALAKVFKVFPDGYNSATLVWENEYLLRSVLECTGKFQISSEIENRSQELEVQLRPLLEKIESTKTVKLTINTGWLLKSDMPSVESLMRARRALLLLNDRNVELVPISNKITNVDDDQALMAFDLEFQINRNYNEEIHSF